MIRLADIRDVGHAALVKCRRAQHQDGGVDEQRKSKRQRGVQRGETHGFAFSLCVEGKGARLHQAGMKVQIVRHHGSAQDADGEVQHLAIFQNFRRGQESAGGLEPQGLRKKDFVCKARGDGHDQRDHQCLKDPESTAL